MSSLWSDGNNAHFYAKRSDTTTYVIWYCRGLRCQHSPPDCSLSALHHLTTNWIPAAGYHIGVFSQNLSSFYWFEEIWWEEKASKPMWLYWLRMQQILKYTAAPGKSFPLQSLFQGSEHKHYHSVSVTHNKSVYILGNVYPNTKEVNY